MAKAKKPTNPYKFTAAARRAAIRTMAATGNRQAAAEAAGVSLSYLKKFMGDLSRDPEFRDAMEEAKAAYIRTLEAEAHRRAVNGWDEERMGPGGMIYAVRKFSDALLIHLLKKKAPEEHGDRVVVDQNTQVSGTLNLEALSPESRELIRQIIEKENHGS